MRTFFLAILVLCAFPLAAQQRPCPPPAYVDFEALSSEAIYGEGQLDSDVEEVKPLPVINWNEALGDVDDLLQSLRSFTTQMRQELATFDKQYPKNFSARFRIRLKLLRKLAR